MSKSINDKTLFKKFIPSQKDKEGSVIKSSYFKVSEEELESIKKLNNSLRGGARPGAGRKPKFKNEEETTTIAFRVPASKAEEIKLKIDSDIPK